MMTTRRRRSFSPEFKAQTVELVRTSGKSVAEVCRDLDLTETAVRRWVAARGPSCPQQIADRRCLLKPKLASDTQMMFGP